MLATMKEKGARRMNIGSIHLPEAWHHTDEEFQSACDDVWESLVQMTADEGTIMLGFDANTTHSTHDRDEENFAEIGAQEGATARSEMWAAFVRGEEEDVDDCAPPTASGMSTRRSTHGHSHRESAAGMSIGS